MSTRTNEHATEVEPTVTEPSVPPFVVAVVQPGFDDWANVGVRVGESVEASTERLEQSMTGLGRRASRYWERCRQFWDSYAANHNPGPGVQMERELVRARQSDSADGRRELTTELHALEAVAVLGALVREATGSEPQWQTMAERYEPLFVECANDGDTTRLSVRYPARDDWEDVLGGVHSRGETARVFEIEVSHAPWRDRRSRRLVGVSVHAVEIWPDPTPYQKH